MNSDGYPIASTFADGITTDAIVSLDDTASIELGDNEININAAVVLVNGSPISGVGGFVVNPMAVDLNANEYSINNIGAVNAAVFIKAGGTNQQYLMADGSSLQYSANSGNSNFYLYNSVTNQSPTPSNGDISYNALEQKQATEIYISHRTRDNIDIEVFFKALSTLNDVYIQDQENSENNITYNIIGPPVIVNQARVTIPVNWTSSNGTGSTSFGAGHNVLVSFFTNSIETDLRITALEGKTQNINASLIGTDFVNNSSFILDPASSHTFTIRNNATPFSQPKFTVSNTSAQIFSVPLIMNGQKITLLAAPVDNNDATRKVYVDDADALKLNLTGGTLSGALNMGNQKITSLGEPTLSTDGATKNYVDSATGGGAAGLQPYYRLVNQIVNITTAGLSETAITVSPALFGFYNWADTAVGQSRKWTIRGLQNRGTFSGVYTLRIKSGATLTDTFVIPAQGPGTVTNLPFILEILQVRTGANSLAFYMKFETVNTGTNAFVAYYTNTNATAGVQNLGTLTGYNLTLQSSVASCSLTVTYIEATAMLK